MRARPLTPAELFPAFAAGVTARTLELRTGIRVRIAESGPADGPPVVMLHGWGASLYTFRHGFDLLAQRGFRVHAVDLRGFGLSARPSHAGAYSLAAYTGDLETVLETLGLERASLVGHSMGGGLALRYTLARPDRVRALALIAPTGLVPATALALVRVAPVWLVEAIGEALVPRWLVAQILAHAAFHDVSRLSARDVDEYWAPTQIGGYTRAVRRTAAEFDWTPLKAADAAEFPVPATVVLGKFDRLVYRARQAAAGLRGAVVHEIAAGHCVHEERPEEVYGLIADALGRAGP
jgi:pimeloyl-ACP methyl ester carboxylesterase